MSTKIDYAAIAAAAAQGENQSEMKEGGGFDREIAKAGICTLRLLQYIETGFHKGNNPKYPKPSNQVMLRFEVNNKKNLTEITLEDGTVKMIPATVDLYLNKGGAGSRYGRLFKSLNYSGRFNHFMEMVGEGAWKAHITHNVVNEGKDNEVTYANLDKDKAWTFEAPIHQNIDADGEPVGSVIQLQVPELSSDPKVFVWENKGLTDEMYLAVFEELYIEGEHEAKDGQPAKSKNWIQDKITSNVKFPGSRLANLLGNNVKAGDVADLENLPIDEPIKEDPKKEPTPEEVPIQEPEPEVPDEGTASAPEVDDDPLAALGL